MAQRSRRRPPTIYAVAERAGVSIATVSRVLQGSSRTSATARDRVLQAAEQLDYRPQSSAQVLAGRRYQAHGVLLGDLVGPYYADLVVGLDSAAAQNGQSLVIQIADDRSDPRRTAKELAGRVDGLVVATSTLSDEVLLELADDLPVLLLGRRPLASCDAVTTESTSSAAGLTEHLLGHGRRSLRFVGDPTNSYDVGGRYAGFTAALKAAGLPVPRPVRVALNEQAGFEIADRLASRVRAGAVDGLVCGNDELALAIVQRMTERGIRVGEDVAVTGWDDVTSARYISPALSTVRQPTHRMGELAATLLHERITGRTGDPQHAVLPTTVVLRASCGCPGGPR